MHRRWSLWIVFCWLLLSGCEKQSLESISLDEVGQMEYTEENSNEINNTEDSIFVYVCGAVAQEGVYELPAGSRVYEAIECAGGFAENAAGSQINQAEFTTKSSPSIGR